MEAPSSSAASQTKPREGTPWLVTTRLAWPAAFVAGLAMILGYLRQPPPPTDRVEERSGETVLREIRALARLETTSLHLEKVIDLKDHQSRAHGLIEADDALLFVAAGEVVLGIDLAKLGDGDVSFDRATGAARIELPAPEVFSARLDEAHSHVHSRSTDLLAKRREDLEAMARREAVTAFEQAGRGPEARAGAEATAEKVLRSLAKGWGVKDLVVTWKAPAGELPLGGSAAL